MPEPGTPLEKLGFLTIGLFVGAICRYFMAAPLPWIVREGIVLAFIYALTHNGVEISLPKLLGGMVMAFAVYALMIKFVAPTALRWLDTRAAGARQLEMRRQQARAAMHNPLLK